MIKKIFLIISSLCLILVSISIAYYFVIFTPQKNNEQLLLAKQKFEYQKEKDLTARENVQAKELQNNISDSQQAAQENINRARAECTQIANNNQQSFTQAVNACVTTLCVNNMLANKDLQQFGEGFIESCTQNRL